MQREQLVFYSHFFCEDASLREGCGRGFYKWVSEQNVCWLSRRPMFHSTGARLRFLAMGVRALRLLASQGPLAWIYLRNREKGRVEMKFRGLHNALVPFVPLDKKEGTI